jgi:DNA polymerase-3 subunit chi
VIVDFYHLGGSSLERVLPVICEKVLAGGGRLLIVTGEAQIDSLDRHLWSHAPDSFLPHGRSDAPSPEAQPILLSSSPEPLNGAANIALADGVFRDEALGFERAFYFFDAGHLEGARETWRALKDKEGVETRYWKQVDGRWMQSP